MTSRANTPLISVVSPVYKAEKILPVLVRELKAALDSIDPNWELILVNDASPDHSWQGIVQEAEQDERIKGINLSRNFGQHYAISAGLAHTKGEWVVVMDCDLQDRPDFIPTLYEETKKGVEIVFASRMEQKVGFFKKYGSKFFYAVYNYFSGHQFDGRIGNFGIYNRKVIREYNKLNEGSRSFPSLIQFLGFKSSSLPYKQAERYQGKTSYTYSKLFSLAFDIILSNSNKPLKLMVKFGFLMAVCSILFAAYSLMANYIDGLFLVSFSASLFSIWFIGGMILFALGVIGLYLGRVFNEVKGRQLYIISEKKNLN